jgi:N-terminal domain on NACHT_NTPase and P-loop NTPases
MSGAEALVALGFASNVVQFIDFGSKLCSRITEYASSAIGAPKKITALAARLDLVLKTLNALNDTGRTTVDHEAKTIQSCISEAQEFDALLNKFRLKTRAAVDGEDGPSWIDKRLTSAKKTWKAFKSLRGEEKIEEFQTSLDRLLSLVSMQLQSRTA